HGGRAGAALRRRLRGRAVRGRGRCGRLRAPVTGLGAAPRRRGGRVIARAHEHRAGPGLGPRRGLELAAALGLGLWTLVLAGCPSAPPPEPCEGEGDPVLTLANRGGGPVLADGVEVDVFPPPQGGVFTELDVVIENLAMSELDYLRVTVDAVATG